ncbi:MAG: flavodoxin family protein [Clostridia bacterium]|nr:flavodoxin family protein [Clostridia bacterium]MBP3560767.1 flavodoxin family protein [Clostridia bacterium]
MNKKILVIEGSNRPCSYTNDICRSCVNGLENAEIEVFNAYKTAFHFCNGCNYCEENGKCIHNDLDAFFESFENADLIIFSSPVYNGGFSSPIKALIDRFQFYYTSFYKNGKVQAIKKHRKALFVAAAGRSGVEALGYMEKQLKCAFTILNMELAGSILCSDTDTAPDIKKAKSELTSLLKRSLNNE